MITGPSDTETHHDKRTPFVGKNHRGKHSDWQVLGISAIHQMFLILSPPYSAGKYGHLTRVSQ